MKKVWLLIVMALFSSGANAQWAVGFATILPSDPYLDIENEINFFPIVTYEGERFTWRGPSLAYKLSGLERGEPSFSITLDLAPNQLDTDESDSLEGINDRDFSFMAGVTYTHPFEIAQLTVSAETDITNKHDGQRVVVSANRPLLVGDKRLWMINLSAQVEYLSSSYVNYYFGVDENEATDSVFAQYTAASVIQPGMALSGYYQINKKWNIAASLRLQALADEIKDSPIVDGSTSLNGFMGVTYSF